LVFFDSWRFSSSFPLLPASWRLRSSLLRSPAFALAPQLYINNEYFFSS